MIIAIGSKNAVKVKALEEIAEKYAELKAARIESFAVSSGVAEQPMSLEETITGAKNRATNAFAQCGTAQYSFGIESGLFPAYGTETGFLEASICCIYDGSHYRFGLSCGFEVPSKILKLVLEDNMNLSEACFASGVTSNAHLGEAEGLIGLLSKNFIDRKEYTKQAIVAALIQIQSADYYE